ncbi:hypothetical protein OIU79_027427 [Salix purpurea]|uniref:Uncharacterized protein n=1 Tax=Salix purpurea TaxID=77065 RepID=A0A9Q0VU23_SALPP|nr:hypothetical protein OIU79_027427 [Salix purpurea]
MKLERKFKESGFGFSPVTNQFKVTRRISQCAHDAHTGEERCAELKLQHVQSSFFGGTETWRLSPKVQVREWKMGKALVAEVVVMQYRSPSGALFSGAGSLAT